MLVFLSFYILLFYHPASKVEACYYFPPHSIFPVYCVVLVDQSWLTLCDPRTAAHQTPLSMRFSRQGYWSGLPFPSPGDLPNPGIKPGSPALQADSFLSID